MLSHLRRARRGSDRGFSIVLMSLLLVSMLGVAGLVVDLGAWQVEASRIQQAADAAALAGVVRLPDGEPAAVARAKAVAADNGYPEGADVTIGVRSLGDESLEVTITKRNVSQYFTGVFRGPGTITRRSTSQYVQPVPLGSPRNYLGTATLPIDSDGTTMDGNGQENFFLAVSGHCSRREYGDRISPRSMANPSSGHTCAATYPNPEYDDRGYLFGVSVPEGAGPVDLQAFDIPVCTQGMTGSPIYGEVDPTYAAFDVTVTVRRYDDLDPFAGTELFRRTYDGETTNTGLCQPTIPAGLVSAAPNSDCLDAGRLRSCWATLVPDLGAGEYTIQVDPVAAGDALNERHDAFSLRARPGDTFRPCTSDESEQTNPSPTPPYSATCPQVFGLEHLPIYAGTSNDPLFYLASIDSRHNGKTLQVTLYDAAEGAQSITLIQPNGVPAPVAWEILCSDGSPANPGCDPAENPPQGGRSGATTAASPSINVSGSVGTSQRTFSSNIQDGKYSDRLLRLTFKLPADMQVAYGTQTWWKIQYDCSGCGDRTTWSVKLLGDPVRLVPNAPPAPPPAGP